MYSVDIFGQTVKLCKQWWNVFTAVSFFDPVKQGRPGKTWSWIEKEFSAGGVEWSSKEPHIGTAHPDRTTGAETNSSLSELKNLSVATVSSQMITTV